MPNSTTQVVLAQSHQGLIFGEKELASLYLKQDDWITESIKFNCVLVLKDEMRTQPTKSTPTIWHLTFELKFQTYLPGCQNGIYCLNIENARSVPSFAPGFIEFNADCNQVWLLLGCWIVMPARSPTLLNINRTNQPKHISIRSVSTNSDSCKMLSFLVIVIVSLGVLTV